MVIAGGNAHRVGRRQSPWPFQGTRPCILLLDYKISKYGAIGMARKVLRLTILSSHTNLASPAACDNKMANLKAIMAA